MKKIFNFETFKDYILSLFKISLLCNVKLIFINLYNHINVLNSKCDATKVVYINYNSDNVKDR